MDLLQKQRRQSFKVIFSEAIMVIAVIFMVIVLAFIVSGYWVNPDLKIERQGLLQVSSFPTGANVEIDGTSSWLQKTNTSKVLASGSHTITLSKDGYDSWSKNINILEGLLYRLNYPRLFLKDREKETVFRASDVIMASVSPSHEYLLLINNTAEWSLVNLKNENIEPQKLILSDSFPLAKTPDNSSQTLFAGEILDLIWDKSSSHILFKINGHDSIEWVLLDVADPANSLNLTKSFGYNFDNMKIINDSSSLLLATQNGNLHKINLASKSISAVLIEDVIDFDFYHDKAVFSKHNNSSNLFQVGLLELNNGKITDFKSFPAAFKVAIGRFYEDQYIAVVSENVISLYKTEDFSELNTFELSFSPNKIKIGHDSNFILAYAGNQLAAIEMESSDLVEWEPEVANFGWLDDYMIYEVIDGELVVCDFDGYNLRALAKNVSSNLPVTITDNKWLYYFSDGALIREWLIPR